MAGLTKDRLTQLVEDLKLCSTGGKGTLEDYVGTCFEDFVLRSCNCKPNGKNYIPEVWTEGRSTGKGGVVPDGVFPLQGLASAKGAGSFPESGFIEVKAVSPGTITSSSFDYQLQTMIDVLADCAAAKAGTPGHLFLVTTSGVNIGDGLLLDASVRKVALWHAVVSELQTNRTPGLDNLQVGAAKLLNGGVFAAGIPLCPIVPTKMPDGLRKV
jgi:hypothetical protein